MDMLAEYVGVANGSKSTGAMGEKISFRGAASYMRKKIVIGALLIIVAAVVTVGLWFQMGCLSGQFSHCNFERIKAGMTLHEVESLLGGSGVELTESQLPQIVDRSVSPVQFKAIIAGEKYYQWEDGARYIVIALKGGVVHEKWYYEPSL